MGRMHANTLNFPDRELKQVGGKGRPVSQCNHCRTLRQSRSVHTRCKCASATQGSRPGRGNSVLSLISAMYSDSSLDPCRCCEGKPCTCARNISRSEKVSTPNTIQGSDSAVSSPQTETGQDNARLPPPYGLPNLSGIVPAPEIDQSTGFDTLGNMGDISLDSLLDQLGPLPASNFTDPQADTPDWTTPWNVLPDLHTTQGPANDFSPGFDDTLPTMDPSFTELFDRFALDQIGTDQKINDDFLGWNDPQNTTALQTDDFLYQGTNNPDTMNFMNPSGLMNFPADALQTLPPEYTDATPSCCKPIPSPTGDTKPNCCKPTPLPTVEPNEEAVTGEGAESRPAWSI